jgi:hypothetical protein
MKIKHLAIAALIATSQAKALPIEACIPIESLAGTIMQSRQDGQLLSFWYGFAETQAEDMRPIIIALANHAYSLGEYRSDEYKRHQLIAFKNEVFSTCIREQKW